MTTRRKNILRKVVHILLFVSVFALVPQTVEYYFLKATSPEYWFQYSAIEVRETVNFEDDHLDVLSFAVIKRPVLIEWNDVLFCDQSFTDSQRDARYFTEKTILPRVDKDLATGQDVLVPWRFTIDGNIEKGDVCYIDSTITAKLRFGIEKVSHLKSNEFVVQ